jgi:hypothetical protein
VDRGLSLTIELLALNPFLAIPVLIVASAAIAVYRSVRLAALAMLPWSAVFILCGLTVEDGHSAARIYANWLILILPAAGYGLSLMWSAPRPASRVVAGIVLLYVGWLPVDLRERLTTPYLEIVEHDRFEALLTALPPGVERIIVPDDELMWRRYHSTLEVYRKYAAIFSTRPATGRDVQLVPLTEYLDNPRRTSCAGGACVFFAGIPCMDEEMYAVTRGQCEELLGTHRTSLLDETSFVAAPFVACSIYIGELKRQLCDPATSARSFKVYRIEE